MVIPSPGRSKPSLAAASCECLSSKYHIGSITNRPGCLGSGSVPVRPCLDRNCIDDEFDAIAVLRRHRLAGLRFWRLLSGDAAKCSIRFDEHRVRSKCLVRSGCDLGCSRKQFWPIGEQTSETKRFIIVPSNVPFSAALKIARSLQHMTKFPASASPTRDWCVDRHLYQDGRTNVQRLPDSGTAGECNTTSPTNKPNDRWKLPPQSVSWHRAR